MGDSLPRLIPILRQKAEYVPNELSDLAKNISSRTQELLGLFMLLVVEYENKDITIKQKVS